MDTGWPFLVARGRTRDYRTVLVPDLLAGRGMQALLADALAIPDPSSGRRTMMIYPRDMEPLTITARAEAASIDTVGGDPRDEHGRPMEFLYGVVQLHPTSAPDLAQAREQALASYRRFLADEENFTFDVAGAFGDPTPMESVIDAEPLPPMALRAAPVRARSPARRPPLTRPLPQQSRTPGRAPRLVAVAVAAAVAVGVLIAVLALRSSSSPAMTLTVCADQSGSRLLGQITLDADADVRFLLRQGGTELPLSARFGAGRNAVDIALPDGRTGSFDVRAEISGHETVTTKAPAGCGTR